MVEVGDAISNPADEKGMFYQPSSTETPEVMEETRPADETLPTHEVEELPAVNGAHTEAEAGTETQGAATERSAEDEAAKAVEMELEEGELLDDDLPVEEVEAAARASEATSMEEEVNSTLAEEVEVAAVASEAPLMEEEATSMLVEEVPPARLANEPPAAANATEDAEATAAAAAAGATEEVEEKPAAAESHAEAAAVPGHLDTTPAEAVTTEEGAALEAMQIEEEPQDLQTLPEEVDPGTAAEASQAKVGQERAESPASVNEVQKQEAATAEAEVLEQAADGAEAEPELVASTMEVETADASTPAPALAEDAGRSGEAPAAPEEPRTSSVDAAAPVVPEPSAKEDDAAPTAVKTEETPALGEKAEESQKAEPVKPAETTPASSATKEAESPGESEGLKRLPAQAKRPVNSLQVSMACRLAPLPPGQVKKEDSSPKTSSKVEGNFTSGGSTGSKASSLPSRYTRPLVEVYRSRLVGNRRKLTDEMMRRVVEEVQDTDLTEIDLSQNLLTSSSLPEVLEICKRSSRTLRILKLFKNGFGGDSSWQGWGERGWGGLFKVCKELRELHLSHNCFTPPGVIDLVREVMVHRPEDLPPLWLRVEQNKGVDDQSDLLRQLQDLFPICYRQNRCTQFQCCMGSRLHVPFLGMTKNNLPLRSEQWEMPSWQEHSYQERPPGWWESSSYDAHQYFEDSTGERYHVDFWGQQEPISVSDSPSPSPVRKVGLKVVLKPAPRSGSTRNRSRSRSPSKARKVTVKKDESSEPSRRRERYQGRSVKDESSEPSRRRERYQGRSVKANSKAARESRASLQPRSKRRGRSWSYTYEYYSSSRSRSLVRPKKPPKRDSRGQKEHRSPRGRTKPSKVEDKKRPRHKSKSPVLRKKVKQEPRQAEEEHIATPAELQRRLEELMRGL